MPTAAPNANAEVHGDAQQPVSAPRNISVNSTVSGNPVEQSSSRASEGPTQPFAGESGVRVVPLHTMVAAVPATFSRMPSDSLSGNSIGTHYPLVGRFQRISSPES